MSEPFHAGEIALQEQAGERDKAILNGRMIGSVVPAAARAFVAQQTRCALAWIDAAGAPWASLVEGPKGFAESTADGAAIGIGFEGRGPSGHPGAAELQAGQEVGLLFVEFETRRRLRVNGTVADVHDWGFRLSVAQAYPNCPRYIQKRKVSRTLSALASETSRRSGSGLPEDIEAWLRNTDTMFVASAHPQRGVDCSHRGGRPGFMTLVSGDIRVPDYPGNSMFGTLGNIAVNPAAGLCMLDFERNLQLRLTGHAAVRLGEVEEGDDTAGSGRWWTFRAERWAVSPLQAHTRWELVEASPYNP